MRRFVLICVVSFIILGSDLMGHFAIAMGAGVLVGALLFLAAAASGGGMRPVGLAAPHLMGDLPKHPTDPRAGIGCALAASGIASSVVTNAHYPYPFRVFYGFCIVAGVVIALGLAWRSRNEPPAPPSSPTLN